MTDRINSFLVVLEKDWRDDDVQPILEAIKMIKGVISVTPNVVQGSDHLATIRARNEMVNKLVDFVNELRVKTWE